MFRKTVKLVLYYNCATNMKRKLVQLKQGDNVFTRKLVSYDLLFPTGPVVAASVPAPMMKSKKRRQSTPCNVIVIYTSTYMMNKKLFVI